MTTIFKNVEMACSAIPALLLAVFYAPLFHVHTHPGEAATIHVHLPEFEPAEDESVVHMESAHSHAAARSVDIVTSTAPQVIQFDATLVSVYAISDVSMPSSGQSSHAAILMKKWPRSQTAWINFEQGPSFAQKRVLPRDGSMSSGVQPI
jgi:hypothetical protein